MSMEPTYEPILLDVELSEEEYFLDMDMAVVVNIVSGETYDGPYEVTPTAFTQTLLTDGLKMAGDVTINPIPSNWGLITWNGSYIMIT